MAVAGGPSEAGGLGPAAPGPTPAHPGAVSSRSALSQEGCYHYENPRNVGFLDKTSKNVGTGLVGASPCSDVMKSQVQVDEKGKIVDARFKTSGCGSAIASSLLAPEWVKGKTVEEALTSKNTGLAKELCLPPVKLHCSMLAEDGEATLADYKLKTEPKTEEAEKK